VKMKKFILAFLILTIMSLVNLFYFGVPVHIAKTPKYWSGDILKQEPISTLPSLFQSAAEGLTTIGLPKGRIAEAPIYRLKKELDAVDAAINIIALLSYCTLLSLVCFFGGFVGIIVGVWSAQWSPALQGAAMILFGPPLLFLFMPALLSLGLLFAESSVSYLIVFVPFIIVCWVPAVFIAFLIILFLVSLAVDSGGGSANGETASSDLKVNRETDGLPAGTRIHPRTGVVQTRGLLGWEDSNERIQPGTGVVQKRGLLNLWWEDK
jgi:hypothetical protein